MNKSCRGNNWNIEQPNSNLTFLLHHHQDERRVDGFRRRLEAAGLPCFFAPRDIGPGPWRPQIEHALCRSTVIIVCLSHRFQSPGFKEEELSIAIDLAEKRSEALLLLPLRLEPSASIPYRLLGWQYFNLYVRGSYKRLIKGIKSRLAVTPRRQHLQCPLQRRTTERTLSDGQSMIIRQHGWEAHIIADRTAPEIFHLVIQRHGDAQIHLLAQERTREAAVQRCRAELYRLSSGYCKAA